MKESNIIITLKTTGYIYAVILFEFLQIPTMQFTILGVLMVIDFMAWISKQFVVNPKEITSNRAWLGIMKKVWTLISIIAIWLVLKWIWVDGEKYVVAFVSLLIMAEGYSVIQKIYTILTGKIVTEFDAVSLIFRKIGQMLQEIIEKSINSKDTK